MSRLSDHEADWPQLLSHHALSSTGESCFGKNEERKSEWRGREDGGEGAGESGESDIDYDTDFSEPHWTILMLYSKHSVVLCSNLHQDFDIFPHRANIVSIIMTMHGPTPTILNQHDTKLCCTYYLSQVEPRVTLVLIVHQPRAKERNTAEITKMNGLLPCVIQTHLNMILCLWLISSRSSMQTELINFVLLVTY